ncbi:odorant receptor Or1-like [Vanessa tameamea]|uniref:Odorant receptor Or1-like n=1 Tax=Vanessa tameamea TaxID=334116 RepID=A0ABM4ARR4_VANTA
MKAIKSEDLYLNRAKFVMKYLGVWVPPSDETAIHKAYRIFMMSLQYIFLFFQIIFIGQVWGDLEAVSQSSYLLFTQACLCFKVTVLQINISSLKDLLKRMNHEIFLPQSNEHERYILKENIYLVYLQILKMQAKKIKRLLLAFMISSQTTCGLWALKPLFDDVGSRKFPFDMWMPVKPEFSPQYELGYAFQLLTICMSAYMYFGVDSVTLSMVIFACAQLDIIKDKILSIKPIQFGSKKERIAIIAENNRKLIECIKQHQAVVSFTELVENTYHTFLFFQLVGSVGLICMSALRILVEDWQSMQFFSILTYLSVMISQLFVCCWCGHELTATSENLHIVLYHCIWYEQDMKFKRMLCFAMMRMSHPIVLRAGHYISLSRQTFVSILRMSYSYFAVLNQTILLLTKAGKVKKLCNIFLVNALISCTLWTIMPWFDSPEIRSFPFKIWMPLDPLKFSEFIMGYLYQVISIYISALLFFSVDSISLSMIMFGCAQIEIIINKIQKIQNAPISAKLKKEEYSEIIEGNNKLFVECIRQHQAVIRFIELLENTYHANIFFQLSGTVIIICVIGLCITIAETSSLQFYSMLVYMVTMLSQLLLYCWCGSELTTTSEKLRECLYQCPWYEKDAKFRRSLLIAMETMKRPIIFKAGHYIPLSRPTFVSILRTSYSYFAVLNQANNK